MRQNALSVQEIYVDGARKDARTQDLVKLAASHDVRVIAVDAHRLYGAELTGALAWVFGAEGEGMRRLTREHCDQLVRIPMSGTVESLNVSVASAVCLGETFRQRVVQKLS